jgi:hypothetical protein
MNSNESSRATLALLERLNREMPEIIGNTQVVGHWVWIEFSTPPLENVRGRLRQLGFHWNGQRRCWQHPCGVQRGRSRNDPRHLYAVRPAEEMQLNDALQPLRPRVAHEYKIVALRECPLPEHLHDCDTADKAAEYWRLHIATNPYFNPECECLVILMLNTRRRVRGHQLVTIGTLDTLLVHPREVFRAAVIASAAAVILMHNHPSGDPSPSDADIRVTRDLIRAGQLMKIDVIDHVVMGHGSKRSLRELGYFSS